MSLKMNTVQVLRQQALERLYAVSEQIGHANHRMVDLALLGMPYKDGILEEDLREDRSEAYRSLMAYIEGMQKNIIEVHHILQIISGITGIELDPPDDETTSYTTISDEVDRLWECAGYMFSSANTLSRNISKYKMEMDNGSAD